MNFEDLSVIGEDINKNKVPRCFMAYGVCTLYIVQYSWTQHTSECQVMPTMMWAPAVYC